MAKNYICDMDGVLVLGSQVVPGANEFIQRLERAGAKFLVLTNNSLYTPRDLWVRLQRIGLDVPANAIVAGVPARLIRYNDASSRRPDDESDS